MREEQCGRSAMIKRGNQLVETTNGVFVQEIAQIKVAFSPNSLPNLYSHVLLFGYVHLTAFPPITWRNMEKIKDRLRQRPLNGP